jgi:hypothetical protein
MTLLSLENCLLWACSVLFLFVINASSSSVDAAASCFAAVTWGFRGSSDLQYLESKELRLQLEKLILQKGGTSLSFRHVKPTERQEIEMLTRNLVKFHGSPIPLDEMHEHLPGSSWRLAFSTREEIVNQLPSVDASIHLKFNGGDSKYKDNNLVAADSSQRMDYMIQFHNNKNDRMRSLSGVDTLKMSCSWQAAAGLVVFEEDDDDNDTDNNEAANEKKMKIKDAAVTAAAPPLTVLEDIYNRNVGRKGLFVGKSRFIKTTYFDGDVWIECGKTNAGGGDNSNNNNKSFTNIYLRENYEPHFEYSI